MAHGSAGVSVTFRSLQASGVARVTLTIGPGAGTGFAPIVFEMTSADASKTSWQVFVAGIPAVVRRAFHAAALDAAGNALYAGDASSDIVAGAIANVFMNMQGPGDPVSASAPIVDSLASSASNTAAGSPVALSAAAHLPDGGAVGYHWTAACGSFSDVSASSPTWTAPRIVPASGACQIDVTVSPVSAGAATSVTVSLVVVVYAVPVTMTVGTGGGAVTSSTGVELRVPPAAVSSTTTLSVVQLAVPSPPQAVDASGAPVPSTVYEFGPSGLVFNNPITITLPLPPGVASPTVYWSDASGAYHDIGGTVVGDTIQVQVSHFSSGFVGTSDYCSQHSGSACLSPNPCTSASCQLDGTCQQGTALPAARSAMREIPARAAISAWQGYARRERSCAPWGEARWSTRSRTAGPWCSASSPLKRSPRTPPGGSSPSTST
jgi:hypothetical protein